MNVKSIVNRRRTPWIALAALAAALSTVLAAAPDVRARRPVAPPAAPLLAVVVTDQDPAALQSAGRGAAGRLGTGPFHAQRTLNLNLLAIYDRKLVGDEPFDQVTKLILPDGSTYETRVAPVDPQALPGAKVTRPDLAPYPVEVRALPRTQRLASALPAGRLNERQLRNATYTVETLPVSGTWITQHNLYGDWIVEVSMLRSNKVLSTAASTFRLQVN